MYFILWFSIEMNMYVYVICIIECIMCIIEKDIWWNNVYFNCM